MSSSKQRQGANPLESAKAELSLLLASKTELERRIEALQKSIELLEPFYEGHRLFPNYTLSEAFTNFNELGLTNAIRRLLASHSSQHITPLGMRALLISRGFDPSGRSNFLAEIHNVLKRLADRCEVEVKATSEGTGYRFIAHFKRKRDVRHHEIGTDRESQEIPYASGAFPDETQVQKAATNENK